MNAFQDTPNSSIAVEGYAPLLDRNKQAARQEKKDREQQQEKDDDEQEPLVFNSLADMMQAAGNLPSQDLKDNPQVVEAELAFSCLSPGDYQEELILQGMEQQEETAKAAETKNGQKDVTFDENLPMPQPGWEADSITGGYTGDNPVSDEEYCDDDEDDGGSEGRGGGLFDFMGAYESEEDEPLDNEHVAPPRAFRILWDCLSPLITHYSCVFLRRLELETKSNGTSGYLITSTHTSDLEASRSNGFMAMLRMSMSRSLNELRQPLDLRRTAEQRLQGLVLTFNFSRPAAKLETKHWRALTCVLLEIVLFLRGTNKADSNLLKGTLPLSAQAVGMAEDEYNYLVKNTIKIFDIPDPVI